MIDRILSPPVAVAEAFDEPGDAVLFPEEEAVLVRAVAKRRCEFAKGRACARRALGELGLPPAPLLPGERGMPSWPPDVVGSITHCSGYGACAVAWSRDVTALGIDAEPNEPLPRGVLRRIASVEERARLGELAARHPEVSWDRLLFCAKETVYKAWFPVARRGLAFADAIVSLDPDSGGFSARLLVPGPVVGGVRLAGFEGRWTAASGLVATAIARPAVSADRMRPSPDRHSGELQ